MHYRNLICLFFILTACSSGYAQQEFEITINTTPGDTTETFWLQIPASYQPALPCPLLIGWHQWGSDHWEFKYSTDFDSIANARGWIAASHNGVSTTHWNNQVTQSHVVDMIHWIEANYNIDSSRIYMVGSSMGGAAAMIFSNNHLDPHGPMVAAAASMSGIQDCERRFFEQGINYTMISYFGGTPEEVPFIYHRNSAIYFADSTQSMHFNALHLPLYLTFGNAWTDSVWRCHAEDLYAVMNGYSDTVVIHESALDGHGWPGCEAEPICDFFENFRVNRYPLNFDINADENGWWYWANLTMRDADSSFARLIASADTAVGNLQIMMVSNVASASLDLPSIGFSYNRNQFACLWDIWDEQASILIFQAVPYSPISILKNGQAYSNWNYNPASDELYLNGEGYGQYTIVLDNTAVPGTEPVTEQKPLLNLNTHTESSIALQLTRSAYLSWIIYDLLGRRVESQLPVWQEAGFSQISISDKLSSGIYILSVRAQEKTTEVVNKRITIIR